MVKVVQFIAGLKMGGAESLVKDYAVNLDKSKVKTKVMCLQKFDNDFEKAVTEAGIDIAYLSDELDKHKGSGLLKKFERKLATIHWIRKQIRDFDPDVIHYHLNISIYVLIGTMFSKYSSKRLILTVHSEPGKVWFLGDKGEKTDFRLVRYFIKCRKMTLIALHENMKKELSEMFGTNNIRVVNNGIDFTNYGIADSGEDIRKELGIPEDAIVVGTVGRYAPEKNQLFLVDVFNELTKRINGDKYYLMMVGGNGPSRQEIEETIKKNGHEGCSLLLSNRGDIPRLLKAMNIFVFPSVYEGLGIALIEAQKAGLGCVVSENVPEAAIVTNLVRRLSLDVGVEEWANEVISVLDSQDEFVSYGLEKWDMKNVCEELITIYEE